MRSETLGVRGGGLVIALLCATVQSAPATVATDLCSASANPCVVSTPIAVTDGSTIDLGQRELRVAAGGALDVGSGTMTINTGRLTILANGFVRAAGTAATTAGTIVINASDASISAGTSGGALSADGAPGGNITLTVTNALALIGTAPARAISANALLRAAVGGTIQITAGSAVIAGPITVTGGLDSTGGDITIDTGASMSISNMIDASGGEGGTLDIEAGANGGAGDLTVADSATLKADANTPGGFGGSIDLAADGPAPNGNVTINALVTAIGRTAGTEMGGGAGGCISAAADGDLLIAGAAARLTVEGGGPDGDGGEIELSSTRGIIDLQGVASAASPGPESSGGSVSLDAGGDASVSGSLLSTSGDGGAGDLSVTSSTGSVAIAKGAVLDVTAQSAGEGGSICLESGTGGAGTHAVTVEGRLAADGGANGGAGGTIEITGGDSVRISDMATATAAGALGGGNGGTVSILVSPGSAFVEGPIVVAGGSPTGVGGVFSIDAGAPTAAGRIAISGAVDARGFGNGGEIGLSASGGVEVRNSLLASSSTATGGTVEIDSQGLVSIGALVSVDGTVAPSPDMVLDGLIEVKGCTITVCAVDAPSCPGSGTGTLSSLGPSGVNKLTGRDLTAVLGVMRANTTDGHNQIIYDGSAAHEPLITGTITPAPQIVVDASVLPCPRCGNHMIEAPETCDDGNMLDGDGCSASCQVEQPIPGDANGDFVRSADDLGYIITEIFDGDGDTVGTVSGGAFAGAAGADANGDGRVTAADVTETAHLLGQ